MKKLLLYSMLLMGCMSAGVLTSCGSDGDSDGGGSSDGGFDRPAPENASADGFMTIPDGIDLLIETK